MFILVRSEDSKTGEMRVIIQICLIILTIGIFLFFWSMRERIYRKCMCHKTPTPCNGLRLDASNSTQQATRASESSGTTPGDCSRASRGNGRHARVSAVLTNQTFSMPMTPPRYQERTAGNDQGRLTPPPAYDNPGYENPPSYEAAVREDQEGSCGERNVHVQIS